MPRSESPVPTMAKTVSHERRAPDSSFERTGGEREIAPTIDLAAGQRTQRELSRSMVQAPQAGSAIRLAWTRWANAAVTLTL